MNLLAGETSPYLLQHADNPVHWRPWGPAALAEAQEIFQPTMAERVVMGLDEHDRLIAYVLGLSHALNIAFFTALAESGEAAPRLARMSSTTSIVPVATARARSEPESSATSASARTTPSSRCSRR